jgi:hypothetical protein
LHDRIEDETETHVFVSYEIEGDRRFGKYIDRQRQKITPYNGDAVRYSKWETTRAYREPAGQRSHETQSRTKTQEVRKVEHHNGHSTDGFGRKAHTHWTIVRRQWTEESDVITDFDGKQTVTPWRQTGSASEREISSGREHGWTDGWVKDI